ncbi:VOC family protein [bacterium]|nr:VOC family protein [bacterium]
MEPNRIRGVLETCLYAQDLAKAETFYTQVLKLELFLKSPDRHLFFRCGDAMLLIFNPDRTRHQQSRVNGSPVPGHGTAGPGHVAFNVPEAEIQTWREWLIQHDVTIESEVTWPSGGSSLYFRDPANNSLELTSPGIWKIEA